MFPEFFCMGFVIYTNGILHPLAVLIIIFQPAFCSKHIYIYIYKIYTYTYDVCIYLILAALDLLCCEQAFSSCSAWASHHGTFSCCGAQALGHVGFSSCGPGLVVPQHVESSRTRDQTYVPCIGRQILNYWTTSKILNIIF